MSRITFRLVVFVALSLAQTVAVCGQNQKDALAAIAARHEMLQNVDVTYELDETFSPQRRVEGEDDHGKEAPRRRVTVRGSFSWSCRFQYVRGKVGYERHLSNPPQTAAAQPRIVLEIRRYSGERAELVFSANNDNRVKGVIRNSDPLPSDAVVDLSLGLRPKGVDDWISSNDWSKYALTNNRDGTITLDWKHPSPAYEGRRVDRWTFDPSRGYALVKYLVLWKDLVDTEIINSDFRDFSGMLLPREVTFRAYYNKAGAKPVVTLSKHMSATDYKLGALDGSKEEFLATWPDGSVVWDERSRQQIVVRDGPRKLTDADIRQYRALSGNYGAWRGQSGIGSWFFGVNVLLLVLVLGYVFYRRTRYQPEPTGR